jgi:hypothetical protein
VEFPIWLADGNTTVLEVFDATGRLLYRREVLLESGYHTIRLQAEDLAPVSGVLSYRLRVGTEMKSGVLFRE